MGTPNGDGTALEFDWPAFEVGVAEYEEGPTGCKSVAKRALDEPVHFARGRPPGVAVETGGRLAGWRGSFGRPGKEGTDRPREL